MNAPFARATSARRELPELFRWPVHRDFFCAEKPIAWFDTWGEAADYALEHQLFMGQPKRRAA